MTGGGKQSSFGRAGRTAGWAPEPLATKLPKARAPAIIAVLLLPLLGSCSLFRADRAFDFATDCQARMEDADPTGTVGRMQSDVRSGGSFRTDVYVTGTISARSGPVMDHFHCAYNGEALIADDRKSAPPAAASTPATTDNNGTSASNPAATGGETPGPLTP